jgi:hypothetical protein
VGVLLAVALATACAARGVRPVADVDGPPVPRLLGVYTAWAGTLPAVEGLAVGSLSGLAYDAASRRWVAASDEIRVPRLVWFDVALGPALGIAPAGVTKMSLAPAVPADTLTALDMEGLAVFPDGSFAVSHEGHIDRAGAARQPRVLIATRDGVVTSVLHPRPHFTIDPADRTRGVRHNLGFESLTRTPDGRLLAANEQPLAQDGPLTDTGAGGVVRIAEFGRGADGLWAPGREWPYRLEPTPVVAGYDRPCEDGQNGVSSFVALSDTTLLAVERACLLGAAGASAYNPVRLFELSLTGADDVSGIDALAGRSPATVRKRLVLDLASWRADLPVSLAIGSNIEGVALGPPGPKGERTVMLVSDDNFRATQTTAFIWLALE